MFTKINTLQKILFILNCIAGLALLLSYIAPYVEPATFWPLPFFAAAYIILLFTNVIFILFWLFGKKRFALISAVCILLGIVPFLHYISFHTENFPAKKASSNYIRLMDYNIFNFMLADTTQIKTTIPILKIIEDQQPDIISFEEYLTRTSDYNDRAGQIQKILRSHYYFFKAYNITPSDSTGLVIFSKYPIIHQDTIPALGNDIKTEGIYADLKKGDQTFRVYCLHLRSTNFSRTDNAYLDTLATRPKANFARIKHIFYRLKNGYIQRGQQAIALKQYLNQSPYPYIVAGDFNDVPLSFTLNKLSAGLKNTFVEKGSGLGNTFYGNFPGFQLDYIMASPQFNVINYKILKAKLSDHYPVFSDLELKPAN